MKILVFFFFLSITLLEYYFPWILWMSQAKGSLASTGAFTSFRVWVWHCFKKLEKVDNVEKNEFYLWKTSGFWLFFKNRKKWRLVGPLFCLLLSHSSLSHLLCWMRRTQGILELPECWGWRWSKWKIKRAYHVFQKCNDKKHQLDYKPLEGRSHVSSLSPPRPQAVETRCLVIRWQSKHSHPHH